jgi:hypothetical protein
MGKREDMRAAIARQKQREAEAAALQAVAGEAGEPLAKQKKRKETELASRPNVPAVPKPKKPRPKRDAKSRDERTAPAVKRLPPGSRIHKVWDGERWSMMLSIAGDVSSIITLTPFVNESDGSFRGEEELFQMYLKSLEEAK